MTEKDGRWWLFTRMTPDIFVKIVIFTLLFGGMIIADIFFGTLKGEARLEWYKYIFFGVLVICAGMAVLIWSNKTYKISFDDTAVYMGGVEWRWSKLGYVRVENMMRYDDIAELGAGQGQGILPLAYIAILRQGSDWDSGEKFFVSRYQLKDDDVREFAEYLYTKIPEKFPPELIEFMNGGADQE
ncbi:hypothetical protein [Sphingorhabdus contaminans]|uniref:hypothetical protein n=1 Tax=Sphingorhabdus contaminans TaxID=1343899 RepID=UPI003D2B13EE